MFLMPLLLPFIARAVVVVIDINAHCSFKNILILFKNLSVLNFTFFSKEASPFILICASPNQTFPQSKKER